MLLAEHALVSLECALVERLSLGIAALGLDKARPDCSRRKRIGALLAEYTLLFDRAA